MEEEAIDVLRESYVRNLPEGEGAKEVKFWIFRIRGGQTKEIVIRMLVHESGRCNDTGVPLADTLL